MRLFRIFNPHPSFLSIFVCFCWIPALWTAPKIFLLSRKSYLQFLIIKSHNHCTALHRLRFLSAYFNISKIHTFRAIKETRVRRTPYPFDKHIHRKIHHVFTPSWPLYELEFLMFYILMFLMQFSAFFIQHSRCRKTLKWGPRFDPYLHLLPRCRSGLKIISFLLYVCCTSIILVPMLVS